MSKNKKSTPKAKMLTAVLLILFLGSCAVLVFAIVTGQLGREPNNKPTETTPATEVVTTVGSTEDTTIQATESVSSTAAIVTSGSSEVTLGSTYNVDYWVEYKNENGTAGLGALFGAHTQSAVVNFDNGRFTVFNIGYDEYLPVTTGTYSFISDNEIELKYDNSYIATATVTETEDGLVTGMDFPMDIEDTTLKLSL